MKQEQALDSLVLKVKDLVARFYTSDGVVHAVNDVSFHINQGETLGIVGESGCGKSATVLSLMQLLPQPPAKIEQGQALFGKIDLLKASAKELRKIRGGQIGMVFQDSMTSLNPMITIGDQVAEVILEHDKISRKGARARVVELLSMVGIPGAEKRVNDYPHQFSGGMRQRVMIAIALACNPKLLIADEPTTALDVTIQAQVIEQVKRLRDELGMTIIWISHDLGVVAGLVDRVIVMYAGQIVESGAVWDVYDDPQHPYTIGLLESLPKLNDMQSKRLHTIEGKPPDMYEPAQLCPFLDRCLYAIDRCHEEKPSLRDRGNNHEVACWVDMTRKRIKEKG